MIGARKPVNLKDVASKADVATSTVSRFLSNPKVVAKQTGERIQKAIDELGYIPNSSAASLASSRSKVVALLVPQVASSLFDTTIDAICNKLHDDGYTVLLGISGWDSARLHSAVTAAIGRQVEAIICGSPLAGDIRPLIERSGVTYIQIWDAPENPIDVSIGFSHTEAGRQLAAFVANRGYFRPHLLSGDMPRTAMRSQAFKDEWKRLTKTEASEQIVPAPSRFSQARGGFANLRRMDEMPDVVVCSSDMLAQGIIIEAMAAGLKVPEDLAVIGFGNSAIAGEMRPTITTVEIDGKLLAAKTIEVLHLRVNGKDLDKNEIDIGFKIIARQSA